MQKKSRGTIPLLHQRPKTKRWQLPEESSSQAKPTKSSGPHVQNLAVGRQDGAGDECPPAGPLAQVWVLPCRRVSFSRHQLPDEVPLSPQKSEAPPGLHARMVLQVLQSPPTHAAAHRGKQTLTAA